MRFAAELAAAHRELTLAGVIVLAPTVFETGAELTDDQRVALGELHLRRIDLADRVLVVTPEDYVGEAVSRESAHAATTDKPVSCTVATERRE